MPQALAEKPDLDLVSSWYIETFFLLSNSRRIVQESVGSIPLSEITNYALTIGTIEDDLHTFCYIICELDNVYLDHIHSKQKSKTRGASRK